MKFISHDAAEYHSERIADYKAVIADHQRLVRELDVLLNGPNAARQASLCDIVAQVRAKMQTERASHQEPADHG